MIPGSIVADMAGLTSNVRNRHGGGIGSAGARQLTNAEDRAQQQAEGIF
jgi:hypothetical protein